MPTLSPARLIAVKEIPHGAGWLYEPKLDGYRGLLLSNPKRAGSVWSRNGKDLGRFFPELVEMAARLPADTALDGEIVMPTESGVSFVQLQQRLMVRQSGREKAGRELPVAFVAFDLSATEGETFAASACASADAIFKDMSTGRPTSCCRSSFRHPITTSMRTGSIRRSPCPGSKAW